MTKKNQHSFFTSLEAAFTFLLAPPDTSSLHLCLNVHLVNDVETKHREKEKGQSDTIKTVAKGSHIKH